MRAKKYIRLTVLGATLLVLAISSNVLAAEFFGMQILGETITKYGLQIVDESYAKEAFSKVIRNEEGGVSFIRWESHTNDVYCWGSLNEKGITLTVLNKTKKPVQMNYFRDRYELMTANGSMYKLKILTDIENYPDVVNPQGQQTIRVSQPTTDIKYLGVTLDYEKVFIFLRRTEEREK